MLKSITIAGLVAASFTSATAQELPYPDTIIVLDVSNSMWGQIDGIAKILIAREVIGDLVTDLEEDIEFGLVAYGHRAKADCGDIETVVPVGELDPAGFKLAVNSLTPQGRTPLVAAVQLAAEQMNYTTRSARIVLVSDGVESCEGDPAALAATLAENGFDLTVHVIGFDVSGIEDQSGLEALAKLNGGLYLTPETSDELKEDLNSMMEMPAEGMADAHVSDDTMADDTMSDDTMADDSMAEETMADEPMAGEAMTARMAAPETARPGSPIRIEIVGATASEDYIGLSQAGDETVLSMVMVSAESAAHLIMPTAKGSYELRYYSAAGEVFDTQSITVE